VQQRDFENYGAMINVSILTRSEERVQRRSCSITAS